MTYTRRKNRSQVYNQKHGRYYPNFDPKTCVHISLDMLGSYVVPDSREFRYFSYMNLNVNKTKISCKNRSRIFSDMHECDVSITGKIMRY